MHNTSRTYRYRVVLPLIRKEAKQSKPPNHQNTKQQFCRSLWLHNRNCETLKHIDIQSEASYSFLKCIVPITRFMISSLKP